MPRLVDWLPVSTSKAKVQFLCRLILTYFLPQKLVSRSTLRHQGKGSLKDGNNVSESSASKLGIKDLTFLRVLGKGSFGKVRVIHGSSGETHIPYLRNSKIDEVISQCGTQAVQWSMLCATKLFTESREKREKKASWQQSEYHKKEKS